VNYGETLSTLMFASRCMAVKTTPIQHEEIDYAEMCARLQERIGNMEGEMNRKLQDQQHQYESILESLRQEVRVYRLIQGELILRSNLCATAGASEGGVRARIPVEC
jgi:hypothetical protein